MEKGDARLSQHNAGTNEYSWKIVELESHRHIRHTVNELIQLTTHSTLPTDELQRCLLHSRARFGHRFSFHLVHTLQHQSDQLERQSLVWLLILLNDPLTIPLLQQLAYEQQQPRAVRLAASFTLAGMGATRETRKNGKQLRKFATS